MKVEIYDKGGNLVSSWEVDEETCEKFGEMDRETLILEIAVGLMVALKEEVGLDLTPNMIVNEWGKIRVCGREIEV